MHLVAVEAPVLELLLEQRAAHVGGVVQLARAVVVQDLPEHARVPAWTQLRVTLPVTLFINRHCICVE